MKRKTGKHKDRDQADSANCMDFQILESVFLRSSVILSVFITSIHSEPTARTLNSMRWERSGQGSQGLCVFKETFQLRIWY